MDKEIRETLQSIDSTLKRIEILLKDIWRYEQEKNNDDEIGRKLKQYVSF